MSEAAIAKGAEPRIMVVVVDSDKYKFTYKHLGLGSPKSDVEKWGKHKIKLLDTEPNEFKYILVYSYVIFTIDENDCVKELSKLSKEDRWYLCPYVIDELAYDDGRKVAEPFIVE